jgi:hypothetical protein
VLTGHCLCGAVQYEISGEPLALLYCHCEECRRATGSSLNTSVLVRCGDFHIVSGEDSVSFYESSPGNRRHFCSRCGSPVFKRFPEPPNFVTVRAGTLDSDPGIRPSGHIWVSEKAPWYEITDELPRFSKGLSSPSKDAV